MSLLTALETILVEMDFIHFPRCFDQLTYIIRAADLSDDPMLSSFKDTYAREIPDWLPNIREYCLTVGPGLARVYPEIMPPERALETEEYISYFEVISHHLMRLRQITTWSPECHIFFPEATKLRIFELLLIWESSTHPMSKLPKDLFYIIISLSEEKFDLESSVPANACTRIAEPKRPYEVVFSEWRFGLDQLLGLCEIYSIVKRWQ